MPVVGDIGKGARADAATFRPLRNAISGADNYLVRHKNDSTTEAALDAWNANASSSAPVATLWANGTSGTKILEALNSGITLRSPNSSHSVAITNSGVVITGTATVNGTALSGSLPVYRLDNPAYGFAVNSSAASAANTTAFISLWSTVCAAGGGIIFVPPGTYYLNATVLTQVAAAAGVWIQGVYGASALYFNGTTGPFLSFGSAAGYALARSGIRDLIIGHNAAPTSGATIKLGQYVNGFELDHVLLANSDDPVGPPIKIGYAPLIGIESFAGFTMRNCKIQLRNDASLGGLIPIGALFGSSTEVGGFHFTGQTDISGKIGTSYGIRFSGSGGAPANFDTSVIAGGVLIKDHAIGILANNNAAPFINCIFSDSYFDGCVNANIQLQPAATGTVGGWQIDTCWFSSTVANVIIDESNGGTIDGISIRGCYFTNAASTAVNIASSGGAVHNIFFQDNFCNWGTISGGSDSGLSIGACENAIVTGNFIEVNGGAAASYSIASTCTPVIVGNNLLRGKNKSFSAVPSAFVVNGTDAFQA